MRVAPHSGIYQHTADDFWCVNADCIHSSKDHPIANRYHPPVLWGDYPEPGEYHLDSCPTCGGTIVADRSELPFIVSDPEYVLEGFVEYFGSELPRGVNADDLKATDPRVLAALQAARSAFLDSLNTPVEAAA